MIRSVLKSLVEKCSGKITDEEEARYVTHYDEVGDRMPNELEGTLEMVHMIENPAPVVAPLTVHQLINNKKSSVINIRKL